MTALDKSLLSLTHVRWRRLAPIVKELEDHIKDTPGWSQRFEDAVKAAHDSGIIEMQAITTTSEYLHKINEWLYWIPKENEEGRDVYNRICLFYFIMNQPTVKAFRTRSSPVPSTSRTLGSRIGCIGMPTRWASGWTNLNPSRKSTPSRIPPRTT